MKRKINFNNMSNEIKRFIYNYDNTYQLIFNNVLIDLINTYNKKKENKLKRIIVNILKDEWNNNNTCCKFYEYLNPKINFNILIKAMKKEFIDNLIIKKNIKFLLRSLCHYNNSDGLKHNNDNQIMVPLYEIDYNNGYSDSDSVKTIKIELFNFLKDIIDNEKLEQFLFDFIDDNNKKLEYYLSLDKYENLKEDINEDENFKYVFKNYDSINQPHIFNYKILNLYEYKDIFYYKNILKKAEELYIKKNGLYTETIQIKYNFIKLYYFR